MVRTSERSNLEIYESVNAREMAKRRKYSSTAALLLAAKTAKAVGDLTHGMKAVVTNKVTIIAKASEEARLKAEEDLKISTHILIKNRFKQKKVIVSVISREGYFHK